MGGYVRGTDQDFGDYIPHTKLSTMSVNQGGDIRVFMGNGLRSYLHWIPTSCTTD